MCGISADGSILQSWELGMPSPSKDVDFEHLRLLMVEQQLKSREIIDAGVLSAMHMIPREVFVPEEYCIDAYKDGPLPIGAAQTISQPYIVALMTELLCLAPRDRVLESVPVQAIKPQCSARLRRTYIQLSAFPVWRNRPNVYCEHSDVRL